MTLIGKCWWDEHLSTETEIETETEIHLQKERTHLVNHLGIRNVNSNKNNKPSKDMYYILVPSATNS